MAWRTIGLMMQWTLPCQVSKLRHEVEVTARQLSEKYDQRLRDATEAMDARLKRETQEIEDRKSAHVQVFG
jgi:hypothetical protein